MQRHRVINSLIVLIESEGKNKLFYQIFLGKGYACVSFGRIEQCNQIFVENTDKYFLSKKG